jgi:DNA-binding transcriptional LysR family regulator
LSVLLGKDEWPDLVTHKLFTRQLVTACAPAVKKALPGEGYDSLNGQTLIVHEHRPMAWENWARQLGIPVPRAGNVIRFDSMSAVVQGAVGGLGIALVSWPLGENWFRSGQLVRVFPDEVASRDDFVLAHRAGDEKRPGVAELMHWIIEEFSRQAANDG